MTAAELVTSDRRAAVEQYVRLTALVHVIGFLECGRPDGTDPLLDPETVETLFGNVVDLENVASGISSGLFSALWPADDYPDMRGVPEFEFAETRSCLIAARIFGELGRNPERLLRLAESLTGCAAGNLARLECEAVA